MPALLGLAISSFAIVYMMIDTNLPIVFAFVQDGVEIIFVLGGSLGAGIARASFADTVNMLKSFGTIFFYSPPKPLGLEVAKKANSQQNKAPKRPPE